MIGPAPAELDRAEHANQIRTRFRDAEADRYQSREGTSLDL